MSEGALGPLSSLRASAALLRGRPIASFGLSLGLLTSLLAVCCGLGMLSAPWFMCELVALQIRTGTQRPTRRSRAWLGAALVQMCSVLVLGALAFLTLLAVGPDALGGGALRASEAADARMSETLCFLLGAGTLATSIVVPFQHAPALLIDRGGSLAPALLESARMVSVGGFLRSWSTSLLAHGLQWVPALVAFVLASSHATLRASIVWGVLLLPALALCIALGQGMTVASYLRVRPDALPATRATRGALRFVLQAFLLLVLVMAGPVLVSLALLKPAELRPGALPRDAWSTLELRPERSARESYLPDSALRLKVSERRVQVTASDGGGVGTLPLPRGRIVRVRAARALAPAASGSPGRAGAAFAIEVELVGGDLYTSFVDEAGVRLDDTLRQRFQQRLSLRGLGLLLTCLLWTVLWTARAVPRQARLHAELASTLAPEPQREFDRGARRAVLWLLPAGLLSSCLGAWAAWH